MAHAEIQPRSGDIRLWNDGNDGYGDPYDWCGGITWLTPTDVEVGPYMKQLKLSQFKALKRVMQEWGILRCLATTYPEGRNGPKVTKWITIETLFEQIYK